ncbi:hypothetical protein PG994_014199 [Apiospora phragmitis]|uniref:DUF1754-domain-containing protein n=1 Tax=Apiospora phragmitis TaxID=2905665 RepID=A0ABR1T3M6_9PEZI
MPSDDYSSFGGGGALKLKGGKVTKHKKKNKDRGAGSDLEKSLSTGETKAKPEERKKDKNSREHGSDEEEEKKRDGDDDRPVEYKTEAERRHEEFQRKKLLKLSESSSSRPELLKTHKERVEELNTYLSKLSEHHDMPKIGPG